MINHIGAGPLATNGKLKIALQAGPKVVRIKQIQLEQVNRNQPL